MYTSLYLWYVHCIDKWPGFAVMMMPDHYCMQTVEYIVYTAFKLLSNAICIIGFNLPFMSLKILTTDKMNALIIMMVEILAMIRVL